MTSIPFYARLLIVFIVIVAIAQAIPEAVNYVLALVLIGIVLARYPAINRLIKGVTAK